MAPNPSITLYSLGASRSIRIAWLLEELSLPYTVISVPRAPNGLAPPSFKREIGTHLGKSPTLLDGALRVEESGAIVEYLLETYDTAHYLLPLEPQLRAKARTWMHAAEGTLMLHALAILYARWQMPGSGSRTAPEGGPGSRGSENAGLLEKMEERLGVNVQRDLDWVEAELQEGEAEGKFLVGRELSAADVMMALGAQFIFARELGTRGMRWPAIEKWLIGLEEREAYKRAVDKIGYVMEWQKGPRKREEDSKFT